MKTYGVAEAKAHFSELMKRALDGEEVVIAKDHRPLLKLVPIRSKAGGRKPGSGRGQVVYMDEDFNETPGEFRDYVK